MSDLAKAIEDIAFGAFMRAHGVNDEDGGEIDWTNDTRPYVLKRIGELLHAAQATIAKLEREGATRKADVDRVAQSFAAMAIEWFQGPDPNNEAQLSEVFKLRLNRLLREHPSEPTK